jgi:GTP pyrophosphokinase
MSGDVSTQWRERLSQAFSSCEVDRIVKAFQFSRDTFGQLPPSSTRVAELLIDQRADSDTVIAALLAPVVWKDQATQGELQRHFGKRVAEILEGFPRPGAIRTDTQFHRRQDTDELLTSFAQNMRKAVLMLFFRLDDLERAGREGSHEDCQALARESLDLYVPVAGRLGFGNLRERLEDASFALLEPEMYRELADQIEHIRNEDAKCLDIILQGVQRFLKQRGIEGRVHGRTKSLYSIYNKMKRLEASLDAIMDRIGVRIIVQTVAECYLALGLLHTHFRPIPGTFDDYIGLPKENGYQSLHTCVYPLRNLSDKPIEFQIRTNLMHVEAEYGLAAHWRYKQDNHAFEKEDQHQLKWIQSLVDQHHAATNTEEFIQALHKQVFENHVVVFSNGGRIARLPENATVRDYLMRHCKPFPENAQIKVNGVPAGLDQVLKDGDSIEMAPRSLPGATSLNETEQRCISSWLRSIDWLDLEKAYPKAM